MHVQGRIKTALGPGTMTYCRAPHHNNDIYLYGIKIKVLSLSLSSLSLSIYIYIYIYIYILEVGID